MTDQQMRADKPRRALKAEPEAIAAGEPQRSRKAVRVARATNPNRLRRGLAAIAVSGIGIAAIGVFAATNYSATLLAFADPAAVAGRDATAADRDASRPPLTYDQLMEQREKDMSADGDAVTTQVGISVASDRASELAANATQVGSEVERLRNLEDFLWPTAGGVGSPWGRRLHPILNYYRMHAGEDIGGTCGQPIWAAQSGTVVKAASGGYNGGSGNNVRIDHGDILGNKIETAYLHMSKISVKVGQKVNKGDQIGNVGSTGLSTACHLHLALYKNGANVDPSEYVHKPKKSDANSEAEAADINSADSEPDDPSETDDSGN